jgi:hypothetical protein
MTANNIPLVLKSRDALGALGKKKAAALPLTPLGTTYSMAQEAVWIDGAHYAVGRWDGSLGIFAFTASPTQGPIIARAVNSPADEGIQMITPLTSTSFLSSNDGQSFLVWYTPSGNWADLQIQTQLSYNPDFGVANSGAALAVDATIYVVIGHANGRVTIWSPNVAAGWTPLAVVDVRSAHPVNPWGLVNVRGIAVLPGDSQWGYVVTGSEDGNLTVVRVPDGTIMSATVYNPAAQRGINSLAVNGTTLLVANCAVGNADFNLWCYAVTPGSWTVTTTDETRLVVNPSAPQVFNFDVIWAQGTSRTQYFACSTEEGALWLGTISPQGQISTLGYQAVTSSLGAALCCQAGQLALTAYDLYEFGLT